MGECGRAGGSGVGVGDGGSRDTVNEVTRYHINRDVVVVLLTLL